MHRAGGVGGDKFHHHLFAAAEIAAAIGIAEAADVAQDLRIECPAQEEIQEAGPGDLEFFKIGAVQREVLADRFGNFARSHAERPRGNHRGIGGPVAVSAVRGDLNGEIRDRLRRELSGRNGAAYCLYDERPKLISCLLYNL